MTCIGLAQYTVRDVCMSAVWQITRILQAKFPLLF